MSVFVLRRLSKSLLKFAERSRGNHENSLQTLIGEEAQIKIIRSGEMEKEKGEDEVMKKFRQFKQFDLVNGSSDHRFFTGKGSKSSTAGATVAQTSWSKRIHKEWRILQDGLPDSIFVRVYEERMDLLRAVIVGAAGTPYHDGLFFFDVFFPSDYPSTPPKVYYHSHGEQLSPNLHANGRVCLSVLNLNTWLGTKDEKWAPQNSTILQVLLSIQALVLNAKPYFNNSLFGWEAGSKGFQMLSRCYNEQIFLRSCKMMLNTLRKPPNHFEDFVVGYFRERALVILEACKAYSEGAQVGCLTKGGAQNANRDQASVREDIEERNTIRIIRSYILWFFKFVFLDLMFCLCILLEWTWKKGNCDFKRQLNRMSKSLVEAFTQIGVEDCEKFLRPELGGSSQLVYLAAFTTISLFTAYVLGKDLMA